jgi:hypothetical protein
MSLPKLGGKGGGLAVVAEGRGVVSSTMGERGLLGSGVVF